MNFMTKCILQIGIRPMFRKSSVTPCKRFSKQDRFICLSTKKFNKNENLGSIKDWLSQFKGGSVTVTRQNDIAVVEWENKLRYNAFTGSMCCQLDDVIASLENDCPKGVIFRGAGGRFCAGGDLKFVEQIATSAEGVKFSKYMQNVTSRITCLPAVSVALLEGAAYGGGAELAMCADFRLATQTATIAFKQINMGVTTGWGGGSRLVAIVGREMALRLLLSGEEMDPVTALNMRLVDHVLPGSMLADSGGRSEVQDPVGDAIYWLSRLIDRPSKEVVHITKRMVQRASFSNVRESLADELELFESVWGSRDHMEALERFRGEKAAKLTNIKNMESSKCKLSE